MSNKNITEESIHKRLQHKCKQASKGKRVLVLSDTTEYNFERHRGRIKDFTGLGVISDNKTLGFLGHNLLVIDEQRKDYLGWSYVDLFNRPLDNKAYTRCNSSVPIEEKESYKWIGPSIESQELVLKSAKHITFVMDREADIYEVMERIVSKKSDVIIRVRHNRWLENEKGERVKLLNDLSKRKKDGEAIVEIKAGHKKRIPREAKCEVKFAKYLVPISSKVKIKKNYKESIEMYCVQIKEQKKGVPKDESPINWTIWSSKEVLSMEQAMKVIEYYGDRWKIEEAHRLLKTKGFDIESTELESGTKIRKLLLLGMEASIKVMQLKAARSEESQMQLKEVFTATEIKCMEQLNKDLEGKTDKQKNPFNKNSLSWGAWVIARIGGWKGYSSQRPAGTITFKRGLERYEEIFLGYKIALNLKDVYKR